MLVWLDEVGRDDVGLVGGKGASLGEMRRAGIRLPPGFCVTARAYRRFVEDARLWDHVAAALAEPGVAEGDAAACEACAERIRARFEAAELPAAFARAVREAYARLGSDAPVAVRSSATAEDLPEASFAGQQETYLGVRGAEDVCAHVVRCWSSLWTARAIAYRARQGFDHADVALAVVVQAMIEPEIAGVLFTVDPVSGARDEMLVNASWGLGEAVVSGLVTPDTYRLARRGLRLVREVSIGSKERRIVSRREGGTITEPVPEADRARPCLDDAALRALLALGERVESHYGAPQDIEWALADGVVHLLQARPVTSIGERAPAKLGRAQRAVLDDILEHYPDAPLPLDHAAVVEGYEQLQHMLRDVGLHAPPASAVITMSADGVCRIDPALPRPTAGILGMPWRIAEKLRVDPASWRERLGDARPTLADLEAAAVAELGDDALAAHIRGATDLAALIARVRFTDVVAPMVLRGTWLKAIARVAGRAVEPLEWLAGLSYKTTQIEAALQDLADAAEGEAEVRLTLLREPPGRVASALAETAAGAAFLAKVEGFLREHGARTMKAYLPFSNQSWREDPAALYATLGALLRAGTQGGAHARALAGAARFEGLRREVRDALPGALRAPFDRALDAYRAGHVAREETLYAIEEAFVHARRGLAEAAARLAARGALPRPEDVLFARLDEVLAALREGPPDAALRRAVAQRRARRHVAVSAWTSQRSAPAASGGAALRGAPGSPGVARGPVRVVRGVEDFGKLAPGDVLVCPFTDPAWTPLFSLACAVIADTGGPLSHAAIVAREYGIPAVLGTQVGTTELHEGEIVTVDGGRGEVRRVG